jgi:hypothetical protein
MSVFNLQFAAGLGSSEATVGMNPAACHHFGAIGINTSRGRMKGMGEIAWEK